MAAVSVPVTGTYGSPGSPATGTVEFTPNVPIVDGGGVIVPVAPITFTLNVAGELSATLYSTDHAGAAEGTAYWVRETINGVEQTAFLLVVPHDAVSVDLSSVTRNVVSGLEADPGASRADIDILNARVDALDGVGARISELEWIGHSYAFFTYSEPSRRPYRRVADQLGVPVHVIARSGSTMLGMGRTWGGMMTVVGHAFPPTRPWGARMSQRPGASVILSGINDLNQYSSMDSGSGSAADDTARWSQFLAHWPVMVEFVTSWLSLAAWYPYSAISANLTYGGTWVNTSDLAAALVYGLHTSYRYTGGSSSTISFTIPDDWAGRTLALFFAVPRYSDLAGTVATLPYGSDLTFSVGGTAVTPLGVTGDFNPRDLPLPNAVPNTFGAMGHRVARIELPADSAGETFLVTGSTGGIGFEGLGIEAARPVRWCNVPKLASYTNDRLTDARVDATNAATATALASFGNLAGVIDIATPLDTDGDSWTDAESLADGLHPNDIGAEIIANAVYADLLGLDAVTATRRAL